MAAKSFLLLELVCDRESFLAYAYQLAAERRIAEGIELAEPEKYKWNGVNGWENSCIASFIEGGCDHFEPGPGGDMIESPTWKDLAEFLYKGQFME